MTAVKLRSLKFGKLAEAADMSPEFGRLVFYRRMFVAGSMSCEAMRKFGQLFEYRLSF
jgi:hypothetical protein